MGSVGGRGRVRLLDVGHVKIDVQVDISFQIGTRHGQGWHLGVSEGYGWTSIPGKRNDGIGCGWVLRVHDRASGPVPIYKF